MRRRVSTVHRANNILVVLQVATAGLAIGAIVGLAAHVVVADPALLAGAAPAYADEFSSLATADDNAADLANDGVAGAGPASGGQAANFLGGPGAKVLKYERPRYHYASLGRRDPFSALVGGEFEAAGEVGLPDVADLNLVGVAWDDTDRYAMAEDSRGFGFVLRVGDKVQGGKVVGIDRASVTFAQYTAGELSTITLELPLQEEDS
jgi:hypothetical protein